MELRYWQKANIIILLNVTYSRHDIALQLLFGVNQQPLTR
jgi:hypothetical protein